MKEIFTVTKGQHPQAIIYSQEDSHLLRLHVFAGLNSCSTPVHSIREGIAYAHNLLRECRMLVEQLK